jgi:hypothetical protein
MDNDTEGEYQRHLIKGNDISNDGGFYLNTQVNREEAENVETMVQMRLGIGHIQWLPSFSKNR